MNRIRGVIKLIFSPRYLLITNTLSYGVLMGIGDSGLQLVNNYIEKKKNDEKLIEKVSNQIIDDKHNNEMPCNKSLQKNIDLNRVG